MVGVCVVVRKGIFSTKKLMPVQTVKFDFRFMFLFISVQENQEFNIFFYTLLCAFILSYRTASKNKQN